MSKERTIITQKLCDHVKALLAGKLTHKQAAEFTGIGKATVDRIVAAGFNAEQYAKNTAARKEEREQKKAEEQKPAGKYECVYTGEIEAPRDGFELTPEGPMKTEEMLAAREAMQRYKLEHYGDQVPGQMEMQLGNLWDGGVKAEMVIPLKDVLDEVLKDRFYGMMRFQADKVHGIKELIAENNAKLDKIIDLLSQILRRTDK